MILICQLLGAMGTAFWCTNFFQLMLGSEVTWSYCFYRNVHLNFHLFCWDEKGVGDPSGTVNSLETVCRNGFFKIYSHIAWAKMGMVYPRGPGDGLNNNTAAEIDSATWKTKNLVLYNDIARNKRNCTTVL